MQELAEVRELMMIEGSYQPDMTIASCNDESTVLSTKLADHAELMVKKIQSIVDKLHIESERNYVTVGLPVPCLKKGCGDTQRCRNVKQWVAEEDEPRQLEGQLECCAHTFLAVDDFLHTGDVRPETRVRRSSSRYDVYHNRLRISKWRRRYMCQGLWLVFSFIGFPKFYPAGRPVSQRITHAATDVQTISVEVD
jgi:hypothetical protein